MWVGAKVNVGGITFDTDADWTVSPLPRAQRLRRWPSSGVCVSPTRTMRSQYETRPTRSSMAAPSARAPRRSLSGRIPRARRTRSASAGEATGCSTQARNPVACVVRTRTGDRHSRRSASANRRHADRSFRLAAHRDGHLQRGGQHRRTHPRPARRHHRARHARPDVRPAAPAAVPAQGLRHRRAGPGRRRASLTAVAVDAGGETTASAAAQLRIDRTAPSAPLDLAVQRAPDGSYVYTWRTPARPGRRSPRRTCPTGRSCGAQHWRLTARPATAALSRGRGRQRRPHDGGGRHAGLPTASRSRSCRCPPARRS